MDPRLMVIHRLIMSILQDVTIRDMTARRREVMVHLKAPEVLITPLHCLDQLDQMFKKLKAHVLRPHLKQRNVGDALLKIGRLKLVPQGRRPLRGKSGRNALQPGKGPRTSQ